MRRLMLPLLLLLAAATTTAEAQYPQISTYCNSGGTWIPCTNGGGGGSGGTTQDTDDASIAAGQTVDLVANLTMAYDGTVWRRLTFGTAGTASSQVLTVQGIASMTPLLVNGGAGAATTYIAARLSDGTNFLTPSTDVTEDAAETAGGTGPLVLSVRRDTLASSAGTSGDNATINTNATGALYTQPTAGTSGGADGYRYISVGATEDEHAVKASAGILYSITVTNTNAAVRYLKCENDTAANTAPGTDTPEIGLAIPGATTGAGFTATFPVGYSFSTALTCWIVTGAADSDVAEVAANEIMVFYTYK